MNSKASPLVSIIVPAFNSGKYLRDCIASISAQTYSSWELLIADDGSDDDTYTIAKNASEEDGRIRAIRSENKGVSSARNTCIEMAFGKYLCFIDSDDSVEPGCLETLVRCAEDSGADIAQCSFVFMDEDGNRSPDPFGSSCVYSNNADIMRAFFAGPVGYIRVSVWGKLILKETLGSIRFDPELRVHEDAYYIYECCRKAGTAVSTDAPLYIYRQHKDSAMHSGLADKYRDYFKVFDRQIKDCGSDRRLRKMIAVRASETALWLMRIVIADGKENELWNLRKAALEYYSSVVFSSAPFLLKSKLTGLAVMPHIYFAMLKKRTDK